MKVRFCYIHPDSPKNIVAPKPGDAGLDLYSVYDIVVAPFERVLVETGIGIEIPDGYVGIIKDRSSVAYKGLKVSGGVIDSSYRGEIAIILTNDDDSSKIIKSGQKIAQMIIIPCLSIEPELIEPADMIKTWRGEKGFGSTGS